jgi:hypothetical protein
VSALFGCSVPHNVSLTATYAVVNVICDGCFVALCSGLAWFLQ